MVAKFRKIRKKSSRKDIFFSVLLLVLFFGLIIVLIITNVKISRRRAQLNSRIEALKKEVQILEQKNVELEDDVSQAGSREHLEKVAREQLGLKAPGEEVVVITKEEEEKEQTEQVEERKSLWEKIKSIFQK